MEECLKFTSFISNQKKLSSLNLGTPHTSPVHNTSDYWDVFNIMSGQKLRRALVTTRDFKVRKSFKTCERFSPDF